MKLYKKTVWSEEEIQLLKKLRAQYGKNAWEKIAKDINALINNDKKKNGRQCREKYLNCCKFDEENKKDIVWLKEEQRKFYELYLKYGSTWSNFQAYFPSKSLNCIKNKFYCKIRKISRDLINYQRVHIKNHRGLINFNKISGILDLGSELRAWISENNYEESGKSKILFICHNILSKAFLQEENGTNDYIDQVVSCFKQLNFKLKSLGIYKFGVRKSWKLSERNLRFILRADNVILNQQQLLSSLQQKMHSSNAPTESPESLLNSKEEDLMALDQEEQQKFINYKSFDPQFLNQYESLFPGNLMAGPMVEWTDIF